MKKMKWYKNNKGSSLLFVIISIAFVAILGTLISHLTFINIQMKRTDKKAKETFYTNETALNELQIVLEDISGEAMKKAYIGIVNDYANITEDATRNLQDQFAYNYVRYLVNYLAGGDFSAEVIPEITDPALYAGYQDKRTTNYTSSIKKIEGRMDVFKKEKWDPSEWFINDDATNNVLEYQIDNATGADSYVLLKDIQVAYNTNLGKGDSEATAHESTITTDIKLTVPKLNFQSGIFPKYTTYSIIANKYLNVNQHNIEIDGDLYGSAGISVRGNNVKFSGPKTTNIITRGDFYTYQNASLTVTGDTAGASDYVRVWANNFGTAKEGVSSSADTSINMTGDAFIQDDLVLNANSSKVKMAGNNFFGFGYNRLNKSFPNMTAREKRTDMGSNYSSAITINGKNVSLDMSGVGNLKLAGRAYISRGQETTSMSNDGDGLADSALGQNQYVQSSNDIMTGETVAMKSNQLAYLIPGEAVNGGMNPMPGLTYKKLVEAGEEVVDTGKLRSVKTYLAAVPYTKYFYNVNGAGTYVYFYYNFKNESKANEYFANYYNNNKSALEKKLKSSGYINNAGDGVTLSSNISFLAAAATGNIITSTKDGDTNLVEVSSDNNPNGELTVMLDDAVKKAKEYYSMQLELSTEYVKYPIAGSAADGTDFRIAGKDNLEKSQNIPIYNEIVTGESQFATEAAAGETYGFKDDGKFRIKKVALPAIGSDVAVYCIYPRNNPDEVDPYTINSDTLKINGTTPARRGIILAACNINISSVGEFHGMIISKGDTTINANNTRLYADTQLVQQILNYGCQSVTDPKEKFTHYFGLASGGNSTDPTAVDISSYLTYSNWRNEKAKINP